VSRSVFGNLVASSWRILWVASKPLRMGILCCSKLADAEQTRELGLLDIHEDAVKRLIHLYHLDSLLPIRRIDDGMPD